MLINTACRGKQLLLPIECSNYNDEGGKKKQGSQKTDSPYRELNETLSFFSIIIVFKKKKIGPFNVVQLITLPKPKDKDHHAERDDVVSYRIVYKDSI